MVNGSPHGFFGIFRGLRQDDLLSPLMFVIVMKALSKMMKELVMKGSIAGFDVGSGRGSAVSISHLLLLMILSSCVGL